MRRYWDIAEDLRRDIAAGRYPVGERLPTEEQLVEAFETSRHAVREALALLTEEGLIVRRPRAGSVVVGQVPAAHFTQRVASVQELINYPANTERRVLGTGYVQADRDLAPLLQCAPGTSWFCLETIRFAAGSPLALCHTHVYVRPEYAGLVRHRNHSSIMFAEQIADLYGVHAETTEFQIAASVVSAPAATILKVPPGSTALTTIRRYADADGRVFEVSVAVHPAQRYTFNFVLKREKPTRAGRRAPAA